MKDSANYRYLCRLFGPLTAPVSKMCKTKQHMYPKGRFAREIRLAMGDHLGGSIHAVNPQVSIADDLRRDATVRAVEEAMPCVVNIRTEIMVERRDFYYDLLWDFLVLIIDSVLPSLPTVWVRVLSCTNLATF